MEGRLKVNGAVLAWMLAGLVWMSGCGGRGMSPPAGMTAWTMGRLLPGTMTEKMGRLCPGMMAGKMRSLLPAVVTRGRRSRTIFWLWSRIRRVWQSDLQLPLGMGAFQPQMCDGGDREGDLQSHGGREWFHGGSGVQGVCGRGFGNRRAGIPEFPDPASTGRDGGNAGKGKPYYETRP